MHNLFHEIEDGIVCDICFRHCFLRDGSVGFCGVNENREGSLHSKTFGNPFAIHVDPIEKKPLFHFYPGKATVSIGTLGCNFRCPFCQNSSLSFAKNHPNHQQYTVDEILVEIDEYHCPIVAFTYNEPTVSWLWYREIAARLHKNGVKTVLVTNGAMSSQVTEEVVECIDALNVDLKCGSATHYETVLKGSRAQVLENLCYLQEAGLWIELSTLLVPAISDSEEDLFQSATEIKRNLGLEVPWHLSAYHPSYDYEEPATDPTLVMDRVSLLKSLGFYYVYPGNISSSADTYCPNCHSIVIKRIGYSVSDKGRNGHCPQCGTTIRGRFT